MRSFLQSLGGLAGSVSPSMGETLEHWGESLHSSPSMQTDPLAAHRSALHIYRQALQVLLEEGIAFKRVVEAANELRAAKLHTSLHNFYGEGILEQACTAYADAHLQFIPTRTVVHSDLEHLCTTIQHKMDTIDKIKVKLERRDRAFEQLEEQRRRVDDLREKAARAADAQRHSVAGAPTAGEPAEQDAANNRRGSATVTVNVTTTSGGSSPSDKEEGRLATMTAAFDEMSKDISDDLTELLAECFKFVYTHLAQLLRSQTSFFHDGGVAFDSLPPHAEQLMSGDLEDLHRAEEKEKERQREKDLKADEHSEEKKEEGGDKED
ncbi:unnamed protein product [Vitrella brassicaformis CCMP3155]|uniref:BAR domain-containing protein n=2 Tax=Vitrella brassicaformis TaxID=1169539 RepID=A0A0G4H0Q9_VITBC|nr:unnamed protein product [Vitrella brassicaformis CCMP3155]|eukprot:CEM37000.1 unnamed protein product [Vitrella brassicaformis CCMP3155]